jgi:hypothetical protein
MLEKTRYRGKVNITLKRHNRVLRHTTHNTGLPDMALLFAKTLSGNLTPIDDLPRLLDIGYIPVKEDTSENYYNNGVWMSILNSPVNIGGRQYQYDSELNNWVAILTSTVYYSDLNGAILDDVIQNVKEGNIELRARLCSYNKNNRKYLAEILLSLEDITDLKDKTSAIFTWYAELLYNENDSSDVISSDVTRGQVR